MRWHGRPIGLVQVLAGVDGAWVVSGVYVHGLAPMVRRPYDLTASHFCAGRETASPGKQVYCADVRPLEGGSH
jgi:hypothetical protein